MISQLETIQLRDLTNTISEYINSKVQYIDNPRNELSEKNYMLKMMNSSHLDLSQFILKIGFLMKFEIL